MWLVLLTNVGRRPLGLWALSTSPNFSIILPILFAKLAKTPAIAVATLSMDESTTMAIGGHVT